MAARAGGENVPVRWESLVWHGVSIPGRLGEMVEGFRGGGWRRLSSAGP